MTWLLPLWERSRYVSILHRKLVFQFVLLLNSTTKILSCIGISSYGGDVCALAFSLMMSSEKNIKLLFASF